MAKSNSVATRVRGIYRHKSGGYLARLRRNGVSLSRKFTNLATAEQWLTQTKIDLEKGDSVIIDGEVLSIDQLKARERKLADHTVGRLIDRFVATGECRLKPPHLRAIAEDLGHIEVQDLSRAACIEFLENHTTGLAAATYNRWRAGLHKLMSYAVEVDWRQSNPVTGISRKSERGNRRDHVFDRDEEILLQEACDTLDPQLGTIFAICMATGARVAEVTGLQWRHVNIKRGTMRLGEGTTKNGNARTLVVRGKAWERLREHSRVTPMDKSSLVFVNSLGKPFDATKAFRRAADSVGMKTVSLHTCRHTWATRLSRVEGMTLTQLRDAGGWKSLAMVNRYSHEMTDDLAEKLEKMLEMNT